MPSLKNIRTQIASKKSTQKITRAMKLVAASRLRRAQDAIVAARPYANALADAIAEVALRAGAESHPLLDRRTPERITLVLLTSDRGLAGGFNANVFRVTQRFINERKQATPPARRSCWRSWARRGATTCRRRQSITRETPAPTAETATADRARDGADRVARLPRGAHRRDLSGLQRVQVGGAAAGGGRAALADHRRRSARRVERHPPSTPARSTSSTSRRRGSCSIRCCRSTSRSQIYRGLLESIASELGARMTAMDSATNNAEEMIGKPHASVQPRPPGRHHQGADGDRRAAPRLRKDRRPVMSSVQSSQGKVVQVIGPVVDVEFAAR